MLRLIRLFILIVLAPLVLALVYEAYQFLRSGITLKQIEWFLYGLGLYSVLYVVLLAGRIRFFEVLEHELTHTFLSLAFFKIPERLEADSTGGEVKSVRGDFVTALAPYHLPLPAIPLLALKLFKPDMLGPALDFAIGFSLGFHYGALISWEFRLSQPDFKLIGRIFSIVVVLTLNAIWLVIILSVVTGNTAGILDYFKTSWARTKELYGLLLQARQTQDLPSLKDLIEQSEPPAAGGA